MTTLTDLSQLTKSMVKKPVEEPKPAPKPTTEEPTADREDAEVLVYFARPAGNAPQRPHVASRADPAKVGSPSLKPRWNIPQVEDLPRSGRGANPATGELERRRAELKQILKDAGGFTDASTLAALERIGIRCISGRKHCKKCTDHKGTSVKELYQLK